ncbi:hypothetical protein VEE57_11850 [Escherichia coli]|nr:hypothetical protein VEE57_11850 [Escherichia coli]
MAMSEQPQPVAGAAASTTKARTSFGILGAISLSHLLNDMIPIADSGDLSAASVRIFSDIYADWHDNPHLPARLFATATSGRLLDR